MTGAEEMIDRLLASDEIRQLPKRYCHYLRRKDIDAILSLYADDCSFDSPPVKMEAGTVEGGVIVGKEALRAIIERSLKLMDPWPFTHNHVIDFTGDDTADGFVYAEIRSGGENFRLAVVGVYEDKYVKRNGVWLFKSRKLHGETVKGEQS